MDSKLFAAVLSVLVGVVHHWTSLYSCLQLKMNGTCMYMHYLLFVEKEDVLFLGILAAQDGRFKVEDQ